MNCLGILEVSRRLASDHGQWGFVVLSVRPPTDAFLGSVYSCIRGLYSRDTRLRESRLHYYHG